MCTFFFFNDTATTEIYTLSLHDALPILWGPLLDEAEQVEPSRYAAQNGWVVAALQAAWSAVSRATSLQDGDRKSTRLNSSHANISYAVFCLKKKKNAPHRLLLFSLKTSV